MLMIHSEISWVKRLVRSKIEKLSLIILNAFDRSCTKTNQKPTLSILQSKTTHKNAEMYLFGDFVFARFFSGDLLFFSLLFDLLSLLLDLLSLLLDFRSLLLLLSFLLSLERFLGDLERRGDLERLRL